MSMSNSNQYFPFESNYYLVTCCFLKWNCKFYFFRLKFFFFLTPFFTRLCWLLLLKVSFFPQSLEQETFLSFFFSLSFKKPCSFLLTAYTLDQVSRIDRHHVMVIDVVVMFVRHYHHTKDHLHHSKLLELYHVNVDEVVQYQHWSLAYEFPKPMKKFPRINKYWQCKFQVESFSLNPKTSSCHYDKEKELLWTQIGNTLVSSFPLFLCGH